MDTYIKKFFITTYGCQMNIHESEKLAGILASMGYTQCKKPEDADVIVFNTCFYPLLFIIIRIELL